jgi:hypothetical protein
MAAENPKQNSPEDARRLKMWVAVLATFGGVVAVWLAMLRTTLPGGTALGEEKKILDEAQKSFRDVRDDLRNRAEDLGEALQEETNRATSSASSGATTTNP